MIKKVLVLTCAITFLCLGGLSFAADTGPADMVLQAKKDASKKPKPAVFPHKMHQENFKCAECHHSAKDGKQVPYVEGQKIQDCEECHFEGSGMDKKLSSFKNVAHKLCKSCHKEQEKKNPDLKAKFKGCNPCHPKK